MNTKHIQRNLALIISLAILQTLPSYGKSSSGKWDEVVGKVVVDKNGALVGRVQDTAVDLENGLFVGMLVKTGGLFDGKVLTVPPGALLITNKPRTFRVDMEKEKILAAPVFELSKTVGPPQSEKVESVYRYFNQTPLFATSRGISASADKTLPTLGYLKKGSSILFLDVENLQGRLQGYVAGLRGLNRETGRLKGVVISPYSQGFGAKMKIVQPQALRYTLKRNALQINDHEQEFKDSPAFNMTASGYYTEESPERPGMRPAPLVHGDSKRDKDISLKIRKRILSNRNLSVYGQNVEVGTLDGKTTLRGRVVSDTNRATVIAYATAVAGQGNVVDMLEVNQMSGREKAIDR